VSATPTRVGGATQHVRTMMKQTLKKSIAVLIIIFCAFVPRLSSAAISENLIDTDYITVSGSYGFPTGFKLNAGVSGSPTNLRIKLDPFVTRYQNAVQIQCYNTAAYSYADQCGVNSFTNLTWTSDTAGFVDIPLSGVSLNPAKYYLVLISVFPDNPPVQYFGNASSSLTCYPDLNVTTPCSSPWQNFAPYYVLANTYSNADAIVSYLNPPTPAYSVQPSTAVGFRYTFFSSQAEYSWASAGAEIKDITAGTATFAPYVPILSEGLSTYSATSTLVAGHLYFWRPFLVAPATSSSTDHFLYGDWGSFDVVSASASSTPYIPPATASSTVEYLDSFCGGFAASSTILYNVCYVGGYMFVPSTASVQQFALIPYLLQDKFPFAYYYQVKNIISNGSATSTPIGTLTLSFASTSLPFSATLFSPDTVRYFIPDDVADIFKLLTSSTLWLAFGWYVWHRVRGLIKVKA